MITTEEALKLIADKVSLIDETEKVGLTLARGRVNALPYYSDIDLPIFNKSAMDGYLVIDDGYEQYRVKDVVKAGDSGEIELEPDECLQIMTGAPVREGAKRVIMKENVERRGDMITILKRGERENICLKGEDLKEGSLALAKGSYLNPYMIGTLASVGCETVTVYKKIMVDILVTGDELVSPSCKPGGGKIRDINSYTLYSALSALPFCSIVNYNRIGDTMEATYNSVAAFRDGPSRMLLVSGGSSVGEYDYCEAALKKAGFEIVFNKIKVKPGKPVIFAKRDDKVIFGLPGNPVSVLVSFENFVKSALYRMAGTSYEPIMMGAVLAEEIKRRNAARREYLPVELFFEKGICCCKPVRYKGSGNITAFSRVTHLMEVAEGVTTLARGSQVTVREIGR